MSFLRKIQEMVKSIHSETRIGIKKGPGNLTGAFGKSELKTSQHLLYIARGQCSV